MYDSFFLRFGFSIFINIFGGSRVSSRRPLLYYVIEPDQLGIEKMETLYVYYTSIVRVSINTNCDR
jgi:hypothetical protein